MHVFKPVLAAALVVLFCSGCATDSEPVEPIEWSAEWFQCDSRFDCVAVYDSFCKYTGVNTRYQLVYQDWSRQQAMMNDELIPCEPVGDDKPLAAYCRKNVCTHR